MSAEYAGQDGYGPTAVEAEGVSRPNLTFEFDALDHSIERLQKAIHSCIDKIQPVLGPELSMRAVDPRNTDDSETSQVIGQLRQRRLVLETMTDTLAQVYDRIEL